MNVAPQPDIDIDNIILFVLNKAHDLKLNNITEWNNVTYNLYSG